MESRGVDYAKSECRAAGVADNSMENRHFGRAEACFVVLVWPEAARQLGEVAKGRIGTSGYGARVLPASAVCK